MTRHKSSIIAFSLVEVAIAIAITSFCLIALLGLLPVGLKSNQASTDQTVANGILSEIIADLRATPPSIPPGTVATTSQQFGIKIPANPVTTASSTNLYFNNEGQMNSLSGIETNGESGYQVTVNFLTNGVTGTVKTATFVQLQATWPASVAPANAVGSVRTFIAVDRN